jgi:hypothetical protein
MVETFKKKIIIVGRSYGIIIPAHFIKEERLRVGTKYEITMTPTLEQPQDKEFDIEEDDEE